MRVPVLFDDGKRLALLKPQNILVQQDSWFPKLPVLVEAIRYQAANLKPEFERQSIGPDGLWAVTDLDPELMGPVVFARDARFNDGLIDQAGDFAGTQNGYIALQSVSKKPDGIWMAVTAEMVLGTTQEGEEAKPKPIHFCDFASAGSTWDLSSYYRVWLPRVMDVQRAAPQTETIE